MYSVIVWLWGTRALPSQPFAVVAFRQLSQGFSYRDIARMLLSSLYYPETCTCSFMHAFEDDCRTALDSTVPWLPSLADSVFFTGAAVHRPPPLFKGLSASLNL